MDIIWRLLEAGVYFSFTGM